MKTPMERFNEKWIPEPNTGCWIWDGYGFSGRYGSFNMGGRGMDEMAHRASWKLNKGPIPPGMDVCHKCDVPRCVNPEHLFIGSRSDNLKDMVSKKRAGNHQRLDGKPNKRFILTVEQVQEIRALYPAGGSYAKLGKRYGVSAITISRVVSGERYKNA